LIHGKRAEHGVIVHIDFADVHENDCVGPDLPDTPGSDYETWEPSDSRGSSCLLGRRTKYVRRKREAKCDNPVDISSQVTIVKNCSCTEQNYQCDYCFTRLNDQCQFDMSFCGTYDPKQPPAICKGTWFENKGYRRVPGDTCDPSAGVDHMPIERQCPGGVPGGGNQPAPAALTPQPTDNIKPPAKESSSTGIITFLLVFAFVALLIVIVWYSSGRNPAVREIISKCIPEKFLPDFKIPGASYSALTEDVEEDAPVLDLDNENDIDTTNNKEAKNTDTGNDFNPRA